MSRDLRIIAAVLMALAIAPLGSAKSVPNETNETLADVDVENLVRQSYRFVAMYNVNNKPALKQGWNTCFADTRLKDHTMQDIARPNNDSLYISCTLDLRKDPVILEMPAFDSDYVSLMITAYDHYVNIPMSARVGDFQKPEKMLIFTAQTEGYDGEPVEGVDRLFEATGDFVSAVFRVMPHANDPKRFERVTEQMQSVKLVTLSEYLGGEPKSIDDLEFPAVGESDFDIFENNLLEVMQFVFNHTMFDPDNEIDQQLLAAYEPLGVIPGKAFDPDQVETMDGQRVREVAERVFPEEMAKTMDEDGGIEIYIAAEKPDGVPDENWLPLSRGDYDIDVILRIYVPDLEKFETWTPPKAERLD